MLDFMHKIKTYLSRSRDNIHTFSPSGYFTIEQYRKGKLINKFYVKNGVTIEGKNHALNVLFHDVSKTTTWYIGLIGSGSYTTGVAAADTASSHAGWAENTDYDEYITPGGRVVWTTVDSTACSITNAAAPATFTMSAADASLKGIFIINHTTAGTVLWSTCLFTTPINVAIDDQLKITYTVTASGS